MNNGCIPADSMEDRVKYILKGTDVNNPEHTVEAVVVNTPSFKSEGWSSMKRVTAEEAGTIMCCECNTAEAVLTWWAERHDGDDSITGMCQPCLDKCTKR